MDFLKFIDILNFIVMLIIFIMIVYGIFRLKKKEWLLWLPSIVVLTLVLYVEVNEKSVISVYLIGMLALTYTLVASVILAKIDRKKRIAPYLSFGLIFLGLFTIFTIQFGGVVNDVLTMRLFYILVIISLIIIIVGSIISYNVNKKNNYILYGAIGWTIIALAIWSQWSILSGLFLAKTAVLVGILFLAARFRIFEQAYEMTKRI